MIKQISNCLLMFPGQGSQFVGMGTRLQNNFQQAKDRLEEADDVLGFKLSAIMQNGPEDLLKQTENAQSAIYTLSVIIFDILNSSKILGEHIVLAGHSLGEFSAIYAAGGYDFADGLRLVRRRGELMAKACRNSPGKMLAILNQDFSTIEKLCKEFCVYIANINSPIQIVLSGSEKSIDALSTYLKEKQIRGIELKVSGAFHSPIMSSILPQWKSALANVKFNKLKLPLISNVTGEYVIQDLVDNKESRGLCALLERQMTSSVLWLKSMKSAFAANIESAVEVGESGVLSKLMTRINPQIQVRNVLDLILC